MKILLIAINAKYIHSNLAVYNLKAASGFGEDVVEIAEYTINHYEQDIISNIYKKKPDVLAFSCYIWNLEYVKHIACELSMLLPKAAIWVGGPEVSYDAEAFLKENPAFLGVLLGEGEETFRELAEFYQKGSVLSNICGLVYREADGKLRRNTSRQPVDMTKLPFVYRDLETFQNRIIYYESSRGCPFSCSYCLSSIDKKLRFRKLALVKEELQFFLDHQVPQVKFVDRTFNCNHQHAKEIWEYIRAHDNGVTNFHFEIAADLLTEEELLLLQSMRPGLVKLEIGVQSVNEKTLEAICRSMDFHKVSHISKRISEGKNIHQHLDLIAGLPFEDFTSFQNSFDTVYNCKPQELQLGFLKVLKGSGMHRNTKEYGICYQTKPPYEVYYTNWLFYDEVQRIKEVEEMLEIFYNSQQFAYTINAVEKLYASPFAMFEELADFYRREGLLGQNHSRISRMNHLRSFLFKKVPDEIARYEELLLFDLYLRENSKSRPAWAKELTGSKEAVQEFYKKEAQERNWLKDYEGYDWKQMMRMTHGEMFEYQVAGNLQKQKGLLVFDYKNRSPLTQNASYYWIDASTEAGD